MAEETKIIRLVIDASRAVDGSAAATRALEKLEKQQAATASTLDRMEASLGKIGGAIKAQLAIMAADLAARLLEMGKNAIDAASGLDELAEQLGITTRGLQALQFSAVQNGVKLEQLETGISKFSQKIGEAAGGSKEMIESLDGVGVKILDLNGKLRPTETIMQEVAAGLLAIDDPAQRSAASIDFFGKAGSKFLPVLQDMAKGLDAVGAAAERNGAMIEDRVVKRLDLYGDAVARNQLRTRAVLATYAADILEYADKADARMRQGNDADKQRIAEMMRSVSGVGDWLRSTLDETALAGGRFVVTFISYFQSLPDQLPKLFVDALNASIEAVEKGLNVIGSTISTKYPWLAGKAGISGDMVNFGRINGGGANSTSDRFAAANKAGADWEAGKRAEFADYYARQKEERDRAAQIDRQAGYSSDEDAARRGPLGAVGGGGKSNPPVKGAGQDVADRINKQTEALKAAAAAQDEMTAAARGGDVAFAEQEIRLKALQLALSVYGDKARASDAEVQKLAASYERLIRQDVQGKAAQSFVTATTELEKQNVLLEAENRLIAVAPDIRARELAVLKSTQEAQKAGNALTAEDIENRRQAIEANERLKTQAEDLKKAQELWTEPLKQALRDIQTAGADAFDRLLESGNFSFDNLAQTFTKILRRMAAEFLALATIRPVLNVAVQAIGDLGILSPGMTSQLGYGGGAGGVSSSGGMGSLSMPGAGGFGGLFSGTGIGDFFSRPVSSLFSSGAPAGGYADISALLQSGNTGASAAATGGLSIGGALAGLGSIGLGAYQAFSSKSTAGTIGGIGSMVGGVVSMLPIPGAQIVGPLISLASQFLPSLFGGGDTRTHSSTNANLRYGSGGWYTTGGAYGAGANSSQGEAALRSTTTGIDALFGLMGGVKDPSKVWGLDASSWTASGKDWSYTSNATHLVDPSGNKTAWRMNTDGMNDTGAAQVAILSMLDGAVGKLGGSVKTALEAMRSFAPTMEEVGKNLSFVTDTYDRFGKGALTIKPQLDAVTAQFDEMSKTAQKLGLALEPVKVEQEKQTKRTAQDFIDQMLDPLAVQLRALADEREAALESARYIRDNVEGVYVDLDRITTYYAKKEADTKAAAWGSAIDSMEAAIKRLTTGDLSNTSPSTTLSGLRASYGATLAQARAGDSAAIGRLAAEGTDYAAAGRQYFSSSAEYQALVEQIRKDLADVQAALQAPSASSSLGANSQAVQTMLAGNEQLRQIVSDQSNQIASLTAMVDRLTAQLQRVAVVGR